jgi:hypothetical protein
MRAHTLPRGIAMFCAIVLSACATATASAEQRAFECSTAAGTKEFSDEHCLIKGGGSPTRGHTLLSGAVAVAVSNAKTANSTTASDPSTLKGAISGIAVEIECPTVEGSGTLTNAASSVSGELALNYTGCKLLKPAGRGCIVKESGVVAEGVIASEPLKFTTVGQVAGRLKIQPASGTTFAKASIESCLAEKPPKGTYPVVGTLSATASGATVTTTEASVTAEGGFTFGGNPAGIGGSLTISTSGGVPIDLT